MAVQDAFAELMMTVPMSVEVLETELCQRAANMTAALCEWLLLLSEFDRQRGWQRSGCHSAAAWLQWQIGLDRCTAYEKLRVAHALRRFPTLATAMEKGWLPYAKVRAISRIATDANVVMLVELAYVSTTCEVERMVAAYRRCEPDAADAEARAHADRGVSIRHEGATAVFTIRVPAEAGAILQACMDRFLERDLSVGFRARRADAVVAMAEHAVATMHQPAEADDRYLATCHLTPDVFDEPDNDLADPDECPRSAEAPAPRRSTKAFRLGADLPYNPPRREEPGSDSHVESEHADHGHGEADGCDGTVAEVGDCAAVGNELGAHDAEIEREVEQVERGGRPNGAGRGHGGRHCGTTGDGQGCRGSIGGLCCVAPGDGLADDPVAIPRESARRILCDAALAAYRSGDGHGDDIERLGYTRRIVSRRLKRALRLRDGGCRFPGCTHSTWVDAHHIQHWLDLGPTKDHNLVCLCRTHHRLMHEGGWNISGDPNAELFFHQPDGRILAAQPVRHIAAAEQVDDYRRTPEDGRTKADDIPFPVDDLLANVRRAEAIHAAETERQLRHLRDAWPSGVPDGEVDATDDDSPGRLN